MKTLSFALLVITLIAIAAGPATTGAPTARPEISGTLNLLCTPQLLWCEGMRAEFQRLHPKATVEFVRLSSGEAPTRLRNEKANPQFDIWWGGPIDSFIAAKEAGLPEAYNSPNLANLIDPKLMKDPDNYWAGIYIGSLGFASNKNFLEKNHLQPPQSWDDLLNPAFKGQLVIAHPASSGTAYTPAALRGKPRRPGHPLFIAGNTTVLSAQIFIAINDEYDQQKGAALSLVLLLPTLTVFLLQRYWVSRRSYVSVTGKPSGRTLRTTEWYMRWPFILATYVAMFLIVGLYMTIVVGSLTKVWGVDYRPDFRHYETAITRGIEAFMDTTFLSAVATPIAGVAGMVIAYLVVRKAFSGKEALDFITSLSAIIFLTNPRWRILTALILSEVEQGGMSVAAAYSVLLIAIVFGAIGVMYAVTGWTFRAEERMDIALGAG